MANTNAVWATRCTGTCVSHVYTCQMDDIKVSVARFNPKVHTFRTYALTLRHSFNSQGSSNAELLNYMDQYHSMLNKACQNSAWHVFYNVKYQMFHFDFCISLSIHEAEHWKNVMMLCDIFKNVCIILQIFCWKRRQFSICRFEIMEVLRCLRIVWVM